MSSRNVCDEDLNLEIALGSYVPPEDNSANFIGHLVPPTPESSQLNDLMASYARGRMPATHHEAYVLTSEVVRQEIRREGEIPRSISPLRNRLYDSSFAARGLPVDPHLRMLKQYPDFLKIERKPEADNKDK